MNLENEQFVNKHVLLCVSTNEKLARDGNRTQVLLKHQHGFHFHGDQALLKANTKRRICGNKFVNNKFDMIA